MPINQFSNVMYSWAPAGTAKANTFTAQNIFKAATTTDPAAIFQATGTISAIPAMDANAIAMFQGTEGTTSHVFFSSAASNAHFVFRRRQGTYASPTAVQSGNILGTVQWQGYGVSTFGSGAAAEIRGVTNQAFTESARGTQLEFYVTPSNTAASTLGFRLSAGTLLTGHNAEFFGSLFLKNSANINFESIAGVSESVLGVSSANNVGIASPTASGSIILTNRATNGTIQLTAGTSTGTITLATGGATRLTIASNGLATFANQVQASELQISQAAGNNRFLFWQTAGSARWGWYTNNDAESGSNAGSNLLLARYSDAGGLLAGAVITITRANGNITMNGGGGKTTFAGNAINIATAQTPATSAAAGATGDIAWDDTYLYVRMSTGWRRIALGAAF